jgi:hypothetical protein
VAVALNVVVDPVATVTRIPAEPNVEAVPEPATVPVQPAVVYSRTVEPVSAVPLIVGVLLELGEVGVVPERVTAPGALLSLT